MGPAASLRIRPLEPGDDLEAVRALLREYVQSLGIDIAFQGVEEELAGLPGEYGSPRGCFLLALSPDGQMAGCCGLRALDNVDYPDACEMKRLYVRPPYRRLGAGRQLAEATLDAARLAGYRHLLLDTLSDMETARALYTDLGFVEIPPYYHNPIAGAHYLKAQLY